MPPPTLSGTFGATKEQADAGRDDPSRASRRIPSGSLVHLLIVDDDPQVLRSLDRSLGRRYCVLQAVGGEEAVAILAGSQRIDFVLCDLMMPGQDGAAVYEAVRRLRPELCHRFVLMTGGTHTTRGRSFLDEFQGIVLFKPFAPERVFELVDAADVG